MTLESEQTPQLPRDSPAEIKQESQQPQDNSLSDIVFSSISQQLDVVGVSHIPPDTSSYPEAESGNVTDVTTPIGHANTDGNDRKRKVTKVKLVKESQIKRKRPKLSKANTYMPKSDLIDDDIEEVDSD